MLNVHLYSLYQDKNYITQSFRERWTKKLTEEKDLLIQYPVCPPHFFDIKNDKEKYAIMFVGQSTGEWENFTNILDGMELTRHFLLNQKYASYFWNFTDQLEVAINGQAQRPRLNYYWTNVFKIVYPDGNMITNPAFIDEYIKNIQILTYEVDIIKPDIIIFLTGPTFDPYLCQLFQNVQFIPMLGLNNILYRVSAENCGMYFPEFAYKTYHPQYLFKGPGMGAPIVQNICNSIKKDLV